MSEWVVYADPDGLHYVGCVDGDWWRWPAEADGWQQRQRSNAAAADGAWEYPPRQAWLAPRLSGVGREP